MSRIRTGIRPGQWKDEGPAAATVKGSHVTGSLVLGLSGMPEVTLRKAEKRKSKGKAT